MKKNMRKRTTRPLTRVEASLGTSISLGHRERAHVDVTITLPLADVGRETALRDGRRWVGYRLDQEVKLIEEERGRRSAPQEYPF